MATVVYEPTGQVLMECDGIRAAEAVIGDYEQVDPVGVHAGDYGIGATEKEESDYQRLLGPERLADVRRPVPPHPKGAGPIHDPWGLGKLD